MKKIIICFMLVYMSIFVAAQTDYYTYYKLNLDYDKGNINISFIDIEFSKDKIENYFGFYTAGIMGYDNEILNLSFFDVPKEVLWDGINPETGEIDRGGTMELEQVSFELFIPYYENAKEIIIYDRELEEVARKYVNMYSKEYEKIRELDKEIPENEPDKKQEKEISEIKTLTETLVKYWRVLLIVLVALILILIYSLRKKKK